MNQDKLHIRFSKHLIKILIPSVTTKKEDIIKHRYTLSCLCI